MKRRAPAVDDDARRLFHNAVADAVPLDFDRVHHEPPPPPAIPRQHRRDERAALVESLEHPALPDLYLEGGDEAAWLRPGMARGVLRDLRRGRWVVQACLDLHGMTRDEARVLTTGFLADCLLRGYRCVRVVHGKGLRSPGREPVLKKWVPHWLAQRKQVLAFCQARPHDGGEGALLILLQAIGKS